MGNKVIKENRPVVVILGGGYAGVEAAKTLDATSDFFVILIDRKDYFLNNVGSLRASMDGQAAKEQLIPYNKLLKNGVVIQADIEEVHANSVKLFGRAEPLTFNYLIIATGTSYAFPGKVAERKFETALQRFSEFRNRISASAVQHVVIVGGGSVGVELAGEVKHFFPNKSVTIVHAKDKLLNNEPLKEEFRTGLMQQINDAGVIVEYDQRVEKPAGAPANEQLDSVYTGLGSVTTSTGKQLRCDLLMFTTGAHTNIKSLLSGFSHVIEGGRLKVNSHMQVEGYSNVFAIGDVAGKHPQRAIYAASQGTVAAKNIAKLDEYLQNNPGSMLPAHNSQTITLKSFEEMAAYPIVLTFGRTGGMSQFLNMVFGAWVSKTLKSDNVMAPKCWSTLNQQDAWKQTSKSGALPNLQYDTTNAKHERSIKEVTKLLRVDEETTKQLLTVGFPGAPLQNGNSYV